MQRYLELLEDELIRTLRVAHEARRNGEDPLDRPEISLAKDLADRVENLVGIRGIAARIRELEKRGTDRIEIAFTIAREILEGAENVPPIVLAEQAIRVALAILTEGVVAAPLDGIAEVKEGVNSDGSRYLRILYASPIRSAGGTEQALSVLVADYVRRLLGYDKYKPTQAEVERYVEEVMLYNRIRGRRLQYLPSKEEITLIVKNCPVCIDGEPTEEEEVEVHRNLRRVETNRIRGGMVLVIAEGIAQKAKKLRGVVSSLGMDGWEWLEGIGRIEREEVSIAPNAEYMKDAPAGRPIISYPSTPGGFRLRYGRSRNTGLCAVGINPATMVILDEFLAPGTQLKIERPGKAACVAPVDSIEGPTVRLRNGDVIRIDSIEDAYRFKDDVEKILDVGEILINYGDFLENNHPLVEGSYTEEVWIQEVKKIDEKFEISHLNSREALELCRKLGCPMHPLYTYLWHDISMEEYNYLAKYASSHGKLVGDELVIPMDRRVKEILEKLLVCHKVRDGYLIIPDAHVLVACLRESDAKDAVEAASKACGVPIRRRAPTRIGARMGRPEKSKPKMMSPPVHVLFPVGEVGGRERLINSVEIAEVELSARYCQKCGRETWRRKCERCGEQTIQIGKCPVCGRSVSRGDRCPRCNKRVVWFARRTINVAEMLRDSCAKLGIDDPPKVKGIKGAISKSKTPEPLEKGVLRAKHGVWVFKDGTARYDLINLPLTHFMPREIGLSVEKARELGYEFDVHGNPLERDDQLLELMPQDVIISESAGDYLVKVANFVDELLEKYYRCGRFYNAKSRDDLIGRGVIGLSPHTSTGVFGRIIGFTSASVCYAHPFFHAAKRRNCDGEEDSIMLALDALLNFSREFIPEKRGGSMGVPLIMTTIINPREIDSEAHNMDTVNIYPLEFYEAARRLAKVREVKLPTVADQLGLDRQHIGFTHPTGDISKGPKSTAYKRLDQMDEKLEAGLKLAKKIRGVNVSEVAEIVLTSHLIKDLVGNLHAFITQEMQCRNCSKKYRRPPMNGKCLSCGSDLHPTVYEGMVRKYLERSMKIAEEYNVSSYTKQRLILLSRELEMFSSKTQRELTEFGNG